MNQEHLISVLTAGSKEDGYTTYLTVKPPLRDETLQKVVDAGLSSGTMALVRQAGEQVGLYGLNEPVEYDELVIQLAMLLGNPDQFWFLQPGRGQYIDDGIKEIYSTNTGGAN